MYRQLLQFIIETIGTVGWCLDYVQRGYGIGGGASTGGISAWDSWTRICQYKHRDYDFPTGVIIPIWFSGTWNGEYLGHVAALNTTTGEVYTSPYYRNTGHEVYSSIASLVNVFKHAMPDITYLGWSEDIAGQRVIEQEDTMAIIQNTDGWFGRCWDHYKRYTGGNLSREIFNSYIGKDFIQFTYDTSAVPEAQKAMEWQTLGRQADKEAWPTKVSQLQQQVSELSARPTQSQLDTLRTQAAALSASAKDAQAEATQARKDAAESAASLDKLQAENAQAKRQADNFWTALLSKLMNFGGK